MAVLCILKLGQFILCEIYFNKTGVEGKERKKKTLVTCIYSQIMIQVLYMIC